MTHVAFVHPHLMSDLKTLSNELELGCVAPLFTRQ